MKLIDLRDELKHRRTHGFLDDFEWFISPHRWTALSADVGVTAPVNATGPSGVGGVITMSSAATNNNEVGFGTTNKPFLFAADKPLLYEAFIQYAEAATSAANVLVGFHSAITTADAMLDDGGGPPASYSGAVIFKVDGGTVWQFETSIGATQITTVSQHTAGGAAFHRLRIEVKEQGAILEAVPWIDSDGTGMRQMLDANNKPIKHTFAATSAVAMQAGVYLKAGGATNETLLTDYVAAYGLR